MWIWHYFVSDERFISFIYKIKNHIFRATTCSLFPGLRGEITSSPEKRHIARKSGIIFHNPDFLNQIRQMFLIVLIRLRKYTNIVSNVHRCHQHLGFDVKHSSPIFTAARKNVFGKMVTLPFCLRLFFSFRFHSLFVLFVCKSEYIFHTLIPILSLHKIMTCIDIRETEIKSQQISIFRNTQQAFQYWASDIVRNVHFSIFYDS